LQKYSSLAVLPPLLHAEIPIYDGKRAEKLSEIAKLACFNVEKKDMPD